MDDLKTPEMSDEEKAAIAGRLDDLLTDEDRQVLLSMESKEGQAEILRRILDEFIK